MKLRRAQFFSCLCQPQADKAYGKIGRDGAIKIEPTISLLHSITIYWDPARFSEQLKKLKALPQRAKAAYTEPYDY